jgi:alkanesulfonate monooxygenase SsuD/methylene tetrahydromethanopterin reductase-like flavin-dependent oxidoreductase (luciferase family)
VGETKFLEERTNYANGMGGIAVVGDPDRVARQFAELSKAGLRGIAISFVNYADELPYFLEEVIPRLERMGLREEQAAKA